MEKTKKGGQSSIKKSAGSAMLLGKPDVKQKPLGKASDYFEFELCSQNGAIFLMRNTSFSFYDEEKNETRFARYCSSENSIFLDEQNDRAIKTPITFVKGKLFVSKQKPNLLKFLSLHPLNESNGGSLFRMVNTEEKARVELDEEFLIVDAISLIRTKSLEELMSVALAKNIDVDRPVDEIKHDLLVFAKQDPSSFIQAFDNPVVGMKAKVKKAVSYQVINIKDDAVTWFDTNKHIISVPAGQDPVDVFVRYCMTETAAPVVAEIERQLN